MAQGPHFLSPSLNGLAADPPAGCWVAGYAAIVLKLNLAVPFPRIKTAVSESNNTVDDKDWFVLPYSYWPNDNAGMSQVEALYQHLVFALKNEGINLLIFKKLVDFYTDDFLNELVSFKPTGRYSRRIWFLIEYLGNRQLPSRSDLHKKSYVKLVDENQQFAVEGRKSKRHGIINNLPGDINFCPMTHKTQKLKFYAQQDFQAYSFRSKNPELLNRAKRYLLLKDSKASFSIEGEKSRSDRINRWGRAIGQAGKNKLTDNELIRLQGIVLKESRFTKMGYRTKPGFIGEHDRQTGMPIPDHISARTKDLESLMKGLLDTSEILHNDNIDAVVSAAAIAFGFVFIHPFQDGNGRLHRYLIHHVLTRKGFFATGMNFPVSAAILDDIQNYKSVLENYSVPLLDFIDWRETEDHNVKPVSETIDFYRYFDLTPMAEFLYECVEKTINEIFPEEIDYLVKYDKFHEKIDQYIELPDNYISLMVKFLDQNDGSFSKRAKNKEFKKLSLKEIQQIENFYKQIFVKKT